MRKVAALVLVGTLSLGACGGNDNAAVDTTAAPTTEPTGEPIVIRTRVTIADEEARRRSPPARSLRARPSAAHPSAWAGPS